MLGLRAPRAGQVAAAGSGRLPQTDQGSAPRHRLLLQVVAEAGPVFRLNLVTLPVVPAALAPVARHSGGRGGLRGSSAARRRAGAAATAGVAFLAPVAGRGAAGARGAASRTRAPVRLPETRVFEPFPPIRLWVRS